MKDSPNPKRRTSAGRRYAAKLLFQTRHTKDLDRLKRRMCEERVFTFEAPTAKAALRQAKKQARALCHAYRNVFGETVRYEFVGVMELLFLDRGFMEPNETWLDFSYRVTPMERRAKLVRPDSTLEAIGRER